MRWSRLQRTGFRPILLSASAAIPGVIPIACHLPGSAERDKGHVMGYLKSAFIRFPALKAAPLDAVAFGPPPARIGGGLPAPPTAVAYRPRRSPSTVWVGNKGAAQA
jgi:hypothetical protein